jgi:DHA2 family multidrug resistance protein
VGIIQGITAPMAGFASDKINPKIPVITGALLLTTSFFINSFMSYLTEHSFIMTSLYIRGVAMGMMFSPLNAIAFREIPREKMAQASGITNIVRQVGGSFGVAMLTTILTTRVIYHAQMFGRTMDLNSPTYQMVVRNMGHFISSSVGSVSAIASQQSRYLLFSHLNRQAFIQGIDDDFLVSAILTAISIIPVFFLRLKKKKPERKPI